MRKRASSRVKEEISAPSFSIFSGAETAETGRRLVVVERWVRLEKEWRRGNSRRKCLVEEEDAERKGRVVVVAVAAVEKAAAAVVAAISGVKN